MVSFQWDLSNALIAQLLNAWLCIMIEDNNVDMRKLNF